MTASGKSTASIICAAAAVVIIAAFIGVLAFVSIAPAKSALSLSAITNKPVAIDSATFPDAAFQSYVQNNIDTNADGYLSADEANAVECIGVYDTTTFQVTDNGLANSGVQSLVGISQFPNLKMLVASGNSVTELNLRGNPVLLYVDMRGNPDFGIDYDASFGSVQILANTTAAFSGQLDGLDIRYMD